MTVSDPVETRTLLGLLKRLVRAGRDVWAAGAPDCPFVARDAERSRAQIDERSRQISVS